MALEYGEPPTGDEQPVRMLVRFVMAAVGTFASLLLFGVPILFGIVAGIVGPSRGRT